MRLSAITLEGLAGASTLAREGFEAVHAQAAGPESGALADGLSLLRAALDPERTLGEVRRLGLGTSESATLISDGAVEQVEQLDPAGVADLIADSTHRHLTVEAAFAPDPLLFRTLRDLAAREARLTTALGQGGQIRVRVGWLFNRSGTHASVSVLSLQVGDERFTTTRTDRPAWVPALLVDMSRRVHRVDTTMDEAALALAWQAALLAPDRARRGHAEQALASLAKEPFNLEGASLVLREGRPRLGFGPKLLSARAVGAHALLAARWAYAAYVERPDVLVVDHAGPSGAVEWWRALVDASGAPIEQVVFVGNE